MVDGAGTFLAEDDTVAGKCIRTLARPYLQTCMTQIALSVKYFGFCTHCAMLKI